MINISDYFEKPVIEFDYSTKNLSSDYLLRQIIDGHQYDGDWDDIQVVLIGITDGCNSPGNENCAIAPNAIRRELVKLVGIEGMKIADLGNIKGNNVRNRICALGEVVPFLLKNGIVIVVLGGSQDYLHPLSRMVALERNINVAIADSMVDIDPQSEDYTSANYLQTMVNEVGNSVSQFFLIGTQRYFIPHQVENLLSHNNFENFRLGNIRGEQFRTVEPILRDSNILGIDVSVVRSVDMPAQRRAMPNGLFAHELCQMSRYAGISDNMNVVGFFEMNPDADSSDSLGASLIAQAVWHVFDGVGHRYFDYPFCPLDHYDTYVVWMEDFDADITFYRNAMNNRWWVKIPYLEGDSVISCMEEDFKKAQANELPDRWFKLLTKSV